MFPKRWQIPRARGLNQIVILSRILNLSNNILELSNSFDAFSKDITWQSTFIKSTPTTTNELNHRKASKRNKIKGMIINCNGLKSTDHSTKFQALLDLHNPDFVLGTESNLHPHVPTYSVFPPSYTVFRNDRNVHPVFQAVEYDLACVEESGFSADNCETIWTSLKIYICPHCLHSTDLQTLRLMFLITFPTQSTKCSPKFQTTQTS